MKIIILILVASASIAFGVNTAGCSYRNVANIRAAAAQVFSDQGFDIVAYEGYQLGTMFESPGGKVWFVLIRKGASGIHYECCLTKWGNEYHMYNLRAIDAITP